MKMILPYESPVISQNPIDAMEMSVIAAHNAYYTLVDNYWETFAFQFCDKGNHYYDAHISNNVKIFESKFIECNNKISETLIESVNKYYYIIVEIDWSKIKYFKISEFFLHPITVYGFNIEERLFYIADFSSIGTYNKIEVSFDDIEIAYDSAVCRTRNYSILLKKFKPSNNKQINFLKIKEEINLFLDDKCSDDNHCIWNKTLIPRVFDGNYYELAPEAIYYGKNVLENTLVHTINCKNNIKYIYEKKAIYLIYALVRLFYIRICYIKDNEAELVQDISNRIANLHQDVCDLLKYTEPILMFSLKYEVKKDIATLDRIILKTKVVNGRYLQLLQELNNILNLVI